MDLKALKPSFRDEEVAEWLAALLERKTPKARHDFMRLVMEHAYGAGGTKVLQQLSALCDQGQDFFNEDR